MVRHTGPGGEVVTEQALADHEAGLARLATAALDDGLADRVTVVPARLSPHKDSNDAEGAERLAMVRLVFGHEPGVEVDPRELLRPGPSYTYDTLAEHYVPLDDRERSKDEIIALLVYHTYFERLETRARQVTAFFYA